MFKGKTIFISLFLILTFAKVAHSQVKINSDNYDIYINDTLLIEPNQMSELSSLDPEVQKTLSFKPKTDGFKVYYFVSGKRHSEGIIKNKKPDGNWTSWYENGQVNKKIIFKNGKKESKYESWYENGNKNAEGQFKNDLREGDWIFFNQDGSLMGNYKYKKGEIIKE